LESTRTCHQLQDLKIPLAYPLCPLPPGVSATLDAPRPQFDTPCHFAPPPPCPTPAAEIISAEPYPFIAIDPLTSHDSSLVELVEAVRSLDYGRPNDRSVSGMLRERRGTCSTKHLFLAEVLADRYPQSRPQIVHRVYRLDQKRAGELFGEVVASVVPEEGLVDVHRYLTATVEGQRIVIDATFPGAPWNGRSSLSLACGLGHDYPAGADPDAEKRALEAEHCDAAIREPFIAALASFCGKPLADEPICIGAYDPGWPARFEKERTQLEEAVGPWVFGGIHHVGSTAVLGLDAKPIIDILVGVENLETSRACFGPLAELGYLYAPYRTEEMHWFCKPDPRHRTHHLHLVPVASRRYEEELAFRDRLRADRTLAAEYASLKDDLASQFTHDREGYTNAKSDFVRRVLEQGR
jgi:GrpB-like predicted nucleotidyltransferase (UPF0157 family)